MNNDSDSLSLKTLQFDIGQCSDPGIIRSHNEDSLLIRNIRYNSPQNESIELFAIADGMGGYKDGDLASQLAIQILDNQITDFFTRFPIQCIPDGETIFHTLDNAIRTANNEIFHLGESRRSRMATTLVVTLIVNDLAYIANLGDSRVYCLESSALNQITIDHSVGADLVALGKIQPEEIYFHPYRNVVTRFLGSSLYLEPDNFSEILKPEKSLILCSDGLWEMVKDDDIKTILLDQTNAQDACQKLVDFANKNGGPDNISVIIINVTK